MSTEDRNSWRRGLHLPARAAFIDLTCGIDGAGRPAACIMEAIERGIPTEHITISSDGMGSWSTYDESGSLLAIGYAPVDTVFSGNKKLLSGNISFLWKRLFVLPPAIRQDHWSSSQRKDASRQDPMRIFCFWKRIYLSTQFLPEADG